MNPENDNIMDVELQETIDSYTSEAEDTGLKMANYGFILGQMYNFLSNFVATTDPYGFECEEEYLEYQKAKELMRRYEIAMDSALKARKDIDA
tara:strand:- start:11349 stop:11627 length:279 start_codon:yes stop_codon:yes gene_type:complete